MALSSRVALVIARIFGKFMLSTHEAQFYPLRYLTAEGKMSFTTCVFELIKFTYTK